jgi:hypothetical protein
MAGPADTFKIVGLAGNRAYRGSGYAHLPGKSDDLALRAPSGPGDRARGAGDRRDAVGALRGSRDLGGPDVLRLTAWLAADPAFTAPSARATR